MDAQIDLTLYNQVKEKFKPVPGATVLISLTSNNVEELVAQTFDDETRLPEYYTCMYEHKNSNRPYAVLYFENNEPIYFFICEKFLKRECISTSQVLWFKLAPFNKGNIDYEVIKKELYLLSKVLSGNSETV